MIIKSLDKIFNIIFLFSIGLYLFALEIVESQLLFLPSFNNIYIYGQKIAKFILLIFLIYKFFRGNFKHLEVIAYIYVGAFLFFTYSESIICASPFLVLMYMIACKDLDKDKIIRVMFYSLLLIFLLVVVLSLMGVITNQPVEQKRGDIIKIRWLLGYDWRNIAQNHFLSLVLLFVLYKKKINLICSGIILAINIVMFKYTDSKTSFFCVFVVLFGEYIYTLLKNNKIVHKLVLWFSFIFLIIGPSLMIHFSRIYSKNDAFMQKLNLLLTRRLELTHNVMAKNNIPLFEQDINLVAGTGEWVDCSYVNFLFSKGKVFFCIVIILYLVFVCIAYKLEDWRLSLVLMVMLIHAMIEPWFLSLTNFPLIILFLAYLYKYIENKKSARDVAT